MKHLAGGLFAATLVLAVAVPAAAQTDVTVYGFLKVNLENVRAGGVNGGIPSANRVSNDLSILGFKGSEDLGNGLSAFFQMESNVAVDVGGGSIASRNNAVGLRGGFGEIFGGQWESPYRFVSVYAIDPFTAGIFASNSILGNGFTTACNVTAPASFDRRQSNLLQYSTPNIDGFSGRIAYGANEEKTATTNPGFWAGLVTYENGPLYLAYGHERHNDYFASGTTDTGHKIGAAYSIGDTRVRFAFERLRYEPTATTNLTRNAWQLALTRNIGSDQRRASYVRAERSKGNAAAGIGGAGKPGTESGADQISLGYGYNLSKRTEIWTAYTRINNQKTASYNLSANTIPGLAAGQNPSGFGLGITHKF